MKRLWERFKESPGAWVITTIVVIFAINVFIMIDEQKAPYNRTSTVPSSAVVSTARAQQKSIYELEEMSSVVEDYLSTLYVYIHEDDYVSFAEADAALAALDDYVRDSIPAIYWAIDEIHELRNKLDAR